MSIGDTHKKCFEKQNACEVTNDNRGVLSFGIRSAFHGNLRCHSDRHVGHTRSFLLCFVRQSCVVTSRFGRIEISAASSVVVWAL